MKKQTLFFYCTFHVHLLGTGESAKQPNYCYKELVEVGKDDSVPVAFDKWVSGHREELVKKWNHQLKPDPMLTFAYVLA